MLFIQTADGFVLTYERENLINNKFIKDSIIDKIFFGNFAHENCIILYHNENTLKILDKWIREGELNCNIIEPDEDLVEMLDYIAGQNIYLCKILSIMKYGAIDLFGREIYLKYSDICRNASIKYSDLDFIFPKIESDKIISQVKNLLEPTLVNYVSRVCKYLKLSDIELEKEFFLETTYNDLFATENRGRGIPRIINYYDPIVVKKFYISDCKLITSTKPQNLSVEEYRQITLNELAEKYNCLFIKLNK
ncbi:hypothetical protein H012_gp190 [Acanthamoeba polyphaga moumouvirus]|uniref:DUF5866 domain-containing protein n=1 Tax=Acanthamoeba polyphaga moumouvirus TaxID=1269028 RepID=L7RDA2_9VIRU|nr:hypothetical protein H012_gp190 [Acanthamoeba polyphaga moumouvirus]AGC02261.1 hypothetical protein Moumou_00742 [Acanthamoeba polyphaga moumouvirus]